MIRGAWRDRLLNMVSGKFRDFLKENLPFKMKIGLFPLLVSGLFFLATAAWILFEHVFLPWSPVSKDFIWAFLSTVVLYLLLDYGVSAIRKSEATLMESEKYISRILETNASGILVMDRKGVVTYANLEAASLLGALRSDIVGRNYREWPCEIRKTDGTSILDKEILFFRVADTGEALYGMELTVLRQDGTRLLLSVNVAPLVDGEGNISEMVASFSDVTASNEASRLHLKKLHLAAEQSPSGIAIADAAGRIEYGNPMFASVTGYLPEEFLNATKPCPTDISPQACREICDAIASGTEWEGEYWNRRKNGELYWESARLTPIRDQKGRVTNFLWVAQDVTEQRLAEDALRETRERYQNLVEKIHDLVWEIDKDVSFTYISPKLSDLLGYEPEEVLGKTPFDLMPPPEAERVEVLFRPVVDGHLPFEHIESILRDKEGRDVIFTTSGVPYYGRRVVPRLAGRVTGHHPAEAGRGGAAPERGAVPADLRAERGGRGHLPRRDRRGPRRQPCRHRTLRVQPGRDAGGRPQPFRRPRGADPLLP